MPSCCQRHDNERPSSTVRAFCMMLALGIGALGPGTALAVNGFNLIGSGGMSSGLAGADTAVALDFSTINTNPAGMSFVGQHWAAGGSFGMLKGQQQFENGANSREGQDHPLFFGNAGYLHHLGSSGITLGIGFFTVGGLSTDFRDVRTPFGTTDRFGSQLRHYKITPSISYRVTPKFSIGATLGLSYADVALAVTPNSPGAPGRAIGIQTGGSCDRHNGLAPPTGNCLYALGFSPKFGLMYQVNDMVTVGVAYTMASNLPFRHGTVTQNLGLVGLGSATYDAKATGLKWADDLAVGVAIKPTPEWLISLKYQWINWDGALNNVVVDLTNGSNPAVPTSRTTLPFNWRDQHVFAVGTAYDVSDAVTLHGGYNYGNNPVRLEYVDPTTANINVHHIVGGLLYKFTPDLWLDMLGTYAVSNKVTYTHPLWGLNTTSRIAGYDLLASLTFKH